MEFLIISFAAVFTSGLTLFSGFGLGTVLMPVFALFFPVHVAVVATAIVHGANNVLKALLLGRDADRGLVVRFGLPAIAAAFVGAAALGLVSEMGSIHTYSLGARQAVITPVKLVMAVLILVFALFELLPRFRDIKFDRKYLFIGGLLSGFFGGLSGHQGALRSAFLTKVGITTQAFVGTNAVIGLLVDLARIAMYGAIIFGGNTERIFATEEWLLVITGILAAFTGVIIGTRIIPKVAMKTIQNLTGILLLGIAMALGAGAI